MSCLGILDAMRAPILPAYRLVWACLENHANGARFWSVSVGDIAAELSLSPDTVSRAIAALADLKVIRIERRRRAASTYYMLRTYAAPQQGPKLMPQLADSTETNIPQSAVSREQLTPQVADSSAPLIPQLADSTDPILPQSADSRAELSPQVAGVESPPVSKKEHSSTGKPTSSRAQVRARTREAEPERFIEFWLAYPRREARRRAAKAFSEAITKGVEPDAILEGLRRFRFSSDPQFWPHPSTWLNGERWLDESPLAAEPSPKPKCAPPRQVDPGFDTPWYEVEWQRRQQEQTA